MKQKRTIISLSIVIFLLMGCATDEDLTTKVRGIMYLDGEPVDDPIGQSLDRYNETFLEIGEYLGKYIDEIVKEVDGKEK